jgi:CBS domain-containing protein
MKVAELLKNKGQKVITIDPQESIFIAMKRLLEHNIGSLVACDSEGRIVGIISERDILRAVYLDRNALDSKKIADVMTPEVIVTIPEDELDYVMGIMTQNRIRHLPVVTKEGIVGIVSIGDIVKFQLHETQVKNRYLEDYMYSQL